MTALILLPHPWAGAIMEMVTMIRTAYNYSLYSINFLNDLLECGNDCQLQHCLNFV